MAGRDGRRPVRLQPRRPPRAGPAQRRLNHTTVPPLVADERPRLIIKLRDAALARARHRWVRAAALVWSLLVVFLGLCVLDLLRAKQDLEAGQELLADIELLTVADQGGLDGLTAEASARIDRARDRLESSPWLGALEPLPLIGTQLRAAEDLADAASEIGHLAADAAAEVGTAVDAATAGGASRLALLEVTAREVRELRQALPDVELGSADELSGPLAQVYGEFVEERDEALVDLDEAAVIADQLRTFLTGPARYLVLAGNNAEMRTYPLPLSAGVLEVAGGDIRVSDFVSTGDLILPAGQGVEVPQELIDTYRKRNLGREWRITAVSPHFPTTASIYAEMAARSPLGPVDGVIFIDVVTLAQLLAATGPVTVDGTEYTTFTVGRQLLYDNYLEFDDLEDRFERYDEQSRVALALFDEISSGRADLFALVGALQNAGEGRHVMAWSREPALEAVWTELGVDGTLPPDSLLVTLENLGANKLDFFVAPRLTVRSRRSLDDDSTRVDVVMHLENPPRDPTSPYIEGGTSDVAPGELLYRVHVYVPADATDISSLAGDVQLGTDGGLQVASILVRIPEDHRLTVPFSFSLPRQDVTMSLVPAGRILPMQVELNGLDIDDYEVREFDL